MWGALLVGLCLEAPPPRSPGQALVELTPVAPSLRFEIRYATANNFLGRAVYTQARAFLQRPVAEDLLRAGRSLPARGYGLLLFDAYRPWSVTRLFFELLPPEKRRFVAPPSRGSNHNRGCAVDLTLYDLGRDREAEMPSAYDEMTERAAPRYAGGSPEQRTRRDLLRAAMEAQGFTVDRGEWWHFDHKSCRGLALLDLPFEDLPGPSAVSQ